MPSSKPICHEGSVAQADAACKNAHAVLHTVIAGSVWWEVPARWLLEALRRALDGLLRWRRRSSGVVEGRSRWSLNLPGMCGRSACSRCLAGCLVASLRSWTDGLLGTETLGGVRGLRAGCVPAAATRGRGRAGGDRGSPASLTASMSSTCLLHFAGGRLLKVFVVW